MAGSIEKRGKDTYRLVYFCGKNLDGSPARHTKTVHCTKKEAKLELAKFVADVEKGNVIEGNSITFEEFTEIWKRDYGAKELAPTTYSRYVAILNTRILPYFGKFKLDKIKPTDIMKFYDMLENDTQIKRLKNNKGERLKKPLSRKTILEHHRLLRAMLHKAVYWQLLVNNPAERVQPPKVHKPKRRYYDDEQCKFLLEHLEQLNADNIKYKVAIIITIFTGVRLGELMGLEWSDIDFRNGIISINKASQYLQPGQHGAKGDRYQHGEEAADKGVLQWPPQHGAGHGAGKDVLPVVQGKVAHVTLDPAKLALSQRKGAGDHGQQRDDDEAEQDDETDQHHHVKGVFQHIQDQVL